MTSDVWVLADSRTGTAVQAIALAESLEMSYEVKKLEYNFLALLPSCVLGASDIHIKKTKSSNFDTSFAPKIIISAGRRAAIFALFLKKRHPNVKVVQIMRPFLPVENFDLIVVPQHDKCQPAANMIRVIGSLHNSENKIKTARGSIKTRYPHLQNFIALLLGGDTKKHKFSSEEAISLAKQVSEISSNHGINVFITFSRRTSQKVKEIFMAEFSWPHIIYDPIYSSEENPYYGMLADSDFLITTCDSVSMCSEATASGKPLYIFCPESQLMTKHRYFVQQLVDLEIARLLTPQIKVIESYRYSPFNESYKVANFIRENILE